MHDDPVFGNRRFDWTIRGFVSLETRSRIGRLFSPRTRRPGNPLLHLGCGANVAAGFDNLDFYELRFWNARHIGHDLRFPLPYADQAFEGAFSEHALEHVDSASAIALLKQVHRVLKPGSVFRISVPDLGKYVDFYNGNFPHSEFGRFANGCEAIWSLTQFWGHLSCWDEPMLIKQLLAAGFRSAQKAGFHQGSDDRLWLEQPERRWESLYLEAVA